MVRPLQEACSRV
uniref:PDIL2-1 n=1 Tax=Arundo donax TaxID=35708 RepID=A0A0A9F974_ARUDO